jgi:hypothetical protein
LESKWRQSGTPPRLLQDAPPLPSLAAHVWGWFVALDAEREREEMGRPKRITAQHMRDFCWVEGVEMSLWDRRTLRALDSAYMEAQQQ